MIKVGLFVPCYVDQFYPRVAIATLELLEKVIKRSGKAMAGEIPGRGTRPPTTIAALNPAAVAVRSADRSRG